jgi:integral membrane protein (TIGR01906 family)
MHKALFRNGLMRNALIRNRLVRNAIVATAVVLLFCVVFSSSFATLLYDRDFYLSEHQKDGAARALGNSTATTMTDELLSYLHGKGELSTLFNERERTHLADVQMLITKGFIIHYLIIVALIALFTYFYFQRKFLSLVKNSFLWAGGAIVVFSILSFALQSLFLRAFVLFHKVMFTNDLWLLDPATDKLIVLLPLQFFRDFITAVYLESLTLAVVLIGFAVLLDLISRREAEGFK